VAPPSKRVMRVAIGLGTNLGDRRAHLTGALDRLAELAMPGTLRVASLYETPALGPPQPAFLNSAVSLETELSPEAVLTAALAIEAAAGRVRRERWGPRTLDLDLLTAIDGAAHELRLDTPTLTIPHPELARRDFALAPMLEVMPELSGHYRPLLEKLGGPPPVVGRAKRGRDGGYKGWTATARVP
jgi:2-amino-4-hydroxy-6-hydroxymethyldihydropteridine diphosphokinase